MAINPYVTCALDAKDLEFSPWSDGLDFQDTSELKPLEGIIGQDRAVRAIRFGLAMRSFGYNLFVAGSPGTGKKTLVRALVDEIAGSRQPPRDIFYVFNFDRPEHPRAIEVPAGVAAAFREDMSRLVETLKIEIPKVFKSEDYETRKRQVIEEFQTERTGSLEEVQQAAKSMGLVLKTSDTQVVAVPLVEGRELSPEEFEQLPFELRQQIEENQARLGETMQRVYQSIRGHHLETEQQLRDLDQTVALIAAGYHLDELRLAYREHAPILAYLEAAQHDIIQNVGLFLPTDGKDEDESSEEPVDQDPLKRYKVNVIVDNSRKSGAPVIEETHPTYRNLVGYAEREVKMGTVQTDFTLIRAGSLIQANGGFLILDLPDLLSQPLAWESLKRAIQDGEVSIQEPNDHYGLVGTLGLRPEPVSVDLKVIVVGNAELYALLFSADEDFQKLFKIRAEFDTVMRNSADHLENYARFVGTLCDKEGLRHFKREAVGALLRHSARQVSDRNRLSLKFSEIADLIRESDFWAEQNGSVTVGLTEVARAIREKDYRSNLWEEKMQEMIEEGAILLDFEGRETGQLNGLSVYMTGDFAFGKPTRVTAQVSAGKAGVVNIEREARLSGAIHDKGVLILSGYLHGKYGSKRPLALNASICFEQSYSGVDGDSASSTELYAILSRLAGLPLRQSIAVTGSVNQLGRIQPIGGVNEKIEGFFAACKAQGLNGEQGVLIPRRNVQNLVLEDEVVEAVRTQRFHIWAIDTLDEGIEILTGVSAGEAAADDTYPEGSVHALVHARLDQMAEAVRRSKAYATVSRS